MSSPQYLSCHGLEDIPPIAEIERLVTDGRHLVLQFALTADSTSAGLNARSLSERLGSELPEFSVFASGVTDDQNFWLTVKKVITSQQVLAHAEVFFTAASQFRRIAHELMARLAVKLGVPEVELYDRHFRSRLPANLPSDLDEEWEYWFHGFECRFQSRNTGQVLEVRLGFPQEFGVLDAGFFHEFLRTTPGLADVAALLKDGYHDTSRALDVLAAHGYLRPIRRPEGDGQGWVVPDP
jgi:hypothetical protein